MLIKLPNLKVIRRKRAKIELCKFAKIYRRFYHTNVCKILRLWWTISSLVFIKSLSNYSILLILRPLQKLNTVETPATSLQRPLSVLLSPRWPLWRGSTVVLSLTLNALHLRRLSSRHLPSDILRMWWKVYNYPSKGRWIVVDIYLVLFADPEGDSCFSISKSVG